MPARAFSRVAPAIRNDEDAFADVLRNEVAYAGPMRKNLCRMLDDLGFPNCFGVEDTSALFSPDRFEITATSTLIYPIFQGVEMKNFAGGGLDLSCSTLSGANGHRNRQFAENAKTMREFIQRYFVDVIR